MNRGFYLKLAAGNVKKNRKFYYPYLLTFVCTMAMFYIMCAMTDNSGIGKLPGSGSIEGILRLGCYIVGIFAVIFLFYTNSFLIKRRKKELGLYNILGMEKQHIAKVLFCESAIVSLIGFVAGLMCGIVLNKLMLMILLKLTDVNNPFGFEISTAAILNTSILSAVVFFLTVIVNILKLSVSNPITLLRGGEEGEKEPKTKVFLAVIGIVTIGIGYYLGITTDITMALPIFFVAVILIIIGTYALFTAGSIALLKIMRKNKTFYYKTRHFTAVSGMIYRMKQNAAGLASICILSTMVLVMISTTVCLYVGIADVIDSMYPNDVSINCTYDKKGASNKAELEKLIIDTADKTGVAVKRYKRYDRLEVTAKIKGGVIQPVEFDYFSSEKNCTINIVSTEGYKALTGKSLKLSGNETAVYQKNDILGKSFSFNGVEYTVKEKLTSIPAELKQSYVINGIIIVTSSQDMLWKMQQGQKDGGIYQMMTSSVQMNLEGNVKAQEEFFKNIKSGMKKINSAYYAESRQEGSRDVYNIYGGLLFLGVFLGLLFMAATVLIIYYKQISEGYDDKERFRIMQNVGMSHKEVRGAIRSQVLIVFFLPLAMATIHVMAAFPLISKLMALMQLTNVKLFIVCTIATVGVFALVYWLVYWLTAKVYYRIVETK